MGKKAKAKPKAKAKNKKRKRPPKRRFLKSRGPQLHIKKVEKPRGTETFQISPSDTPVLSFCGELIGTASWFPEFIMYARRRTHLAIYRIQDEETREYRFLAHINSGDDWERVYVGRSPILLLAALRHEGEASEALTKLLGLELSLNDSEDFAVLVELTRLSRP